MLYYNMTKRVRSGHQIELTAGGYLGTHTFKCGLLAECQFVDTKINC